MPIFGNQTKKNERLLGNALKSLLRYLERHVTEPDQRKRFAALLGGAYIAADSALELFEPLKRAWGKGDDEKALMLLKPFTLWMLQVWFIKLYQDTDATAELEVNWAQSVLKLFNDYSRDSIEAYKNLSYQFQSERSEGTFDGVALNILIWQAVQAVRECEDSFVERLPAANLGLGVNFPILSKGAMADAVIILHNPLEVMVYLPALNSAEQSALDNLMALE